MFNSSDPWQDSLKEAKEIDSKVKALLIADAALSKKAEDVVIMDMRRASGVCDYFVIASAQSKTRALAARDAVEGALLGKGIPPWHAEGAKEALWILLDYGDVVCHIFYSKIRPFYNLERLWQDAPKEPVTENAHRKHRKNSDRHSPRGSAKPN